MKKAEKIQQQLDEWKAESGLASENMIMFDGWRNMDTSNPTKWVYGRCYYVNRRRCDIVMGYKFEKREFGWLEKSGLWHEFCHAYAYLEDGVSDSHNNYWRKLRRSKPIYYIGDLVCKVIYPLL